MKPETSEPISPDIERRLLTIVFVDLVGYTALAERLDLEELRILQWRFQDFSLRIMERFGGFVARFSGDGVLVYFGYPVAYGNDAERALRSALSLIERLPDLDTTVEDTKVPPLQARIGIHTGVVLISPEQMSAGSLEHSVTGEAVNLAARLQAEAPPGGIVISQETLDLVEGQFEFEGLGERTIKGVSRKVAVYRPISAIPGPTRGATARSDRGANRMVGRDEPLSQIVACWEAVKAEGRLRKITVSGEAGVGKTRLVREFCGRQDLAGVPILQANCHQMFSSTPLYPVATALWARAGLSAEEDEDTRARKVSSMLDEFGADTPENRELAASLLSDVVADISNTTAATPMLLKQKQFEFVISLIAHTARAQPTIIWLEDVHWLDPSSAELLGEIVSSLSDAPILLILTRRSFPKGPALPEVDDVVDLRRLDGRTCREIARSVAGADALSDEIIERAITAAEGVPLFVEQIVISLVETHAESPRFGARSRDVPLMLAEMMTERLDRRPDARQIVRAAACIGRSFLPEFLAAVLERPPDAVAGSLRDLVDAEIMLALRHGGEIRYEFRHTLLQRMAYESVIQSERRALHARIVELLRQDSEAIRVLPEVIAHHLTEARMFPEAAAAWLKAGINAAQRSAHVEAIEQIDRGIAILEKIPDPALCRKVELQMQAAMIGSLVAVEGATSIRVSECCQRGLELCSEGDPTPLAFAFTFGQFTFSNCRGRIDEALALARSFLTMAERGGSESVRVVGHRMVGTVLLGQGQAQKAKEELERSLELYVPERDAATTHMFGQSTEVHTKSALSLAQFCLGNIDEAMAAGVDALRSADALRHPHSTAIPLTYVSGLVFGLSGASDPMLEHSERLIALADQHRMAAFRGHGMSLRGWALCQRGAFAEAAAEIEQGIAALDAIDFCMAISGYLGFYAEAEMQLGNLGVAKAAIARSLELMSASSFLWFEPELRRIEALIALKDPERGPKAAEALLQGAVDSARALGFPVMERRCLIDLKHCLGPRGEESEIEARLSALAHLGNLAQRVTDALETRP